MDNNQAELIKYTESFTKYLVPGLVTIMSPDSKFLFASDATVQIMGYRSKDQVFGTTYANMRCKAAESSETFHNENMHVLQTNRPIKIITYQCFANNDWKMLITEKLPIHNQEKKPIGVFGHFIDVSNAKLIDLGRFLTKSDSNRFKRNQFSYILNDSYEDLKISIRQSECLFLLLRGKSAQAIADILGLSLRTVEGYINEMKIKLNCANKSELIEHAISAGLINIMPTGLIDKVAF